MENQDSDRRTKGYTLMRAIMDYGMGIIIFCIGVFFLLSRRLGFDFKLMISIAIFLRDLPGLRSWRVYRGYKKNYYR